MARAMWTGTLGFGLVSIPVKLYRATSSMKSVSFHLLHKKCGTRIKNVRWCPLDDEAVDWNDVVKGYEVEKGRYVKVDKKELDEILPDEDFASVSIESFVKLAEVDPIYCDTSYVIAPEGNPRAYSLLGRALEDSQRVAIARVTLRTRSHLAMVRAQDGHLVLTTLFFEDEIVKAIPGLPEKVAVDKKQLDAALQLVDSMTAKWDPSKYHDEYAKKVQELVEAKVSGGEVTAPAVIEEEGGQVVDLLSALRKSIKEKGGAAPREREKAHRPRRARKHKKAS